MNTRSAWLRGEAVVQQVGRAAVSGLQWFSATKHRVAGTAASAAASGAVALSLPLTFVLWPPASAERHARTPERHDGPR